MEKNKKILLIVMFALALITIIISIVLLKPEQKEEVKEIEEVEEVEEIKEEKIDNTKYFKEKNLIIQKMTANEKDNSTIGTYILTDGSIYTYRFDQSNSNTGDSLESMIENSTELDKRVSEEDLKLIKKYIDKLKDEREYFDGDQYSNSLTMIKVYNAKGPVLLKATGVQEAENMTDEGYSLLNIINKYID